MKKLVLIYLLKTAFIFANSFSPGREICRDNECTIEGLEMEVFLEVPKSIFIIKEQGDIIDFGEVLKGSDAEAGTTFKLKGNVKDNFTLKFYQDNREIEGVTLSNESKDAEKVLARISQVKIGMVNGDEVPVDLKLRVSGSDTEKMSSGDYEGTFTVRAIFE